MKKKMLSALLIAGLVSPLFAFNNVASAKKAKVAKPTLKTTVTYNNDSNSINFKGSASNTKVKKVVIKYGSKSFTTKNLKNKKFSVSKGFTGYGNFYVYGATKGGKQLTSKYKIGTSKYTTKTPIYYSVDRSKSNDIAIRLYGDGEKNLNFAIKGTITANLNGQTASTATINQSKEVAGGGGTFNISTDTPGASFGDQYSLTATATAKNKQTSREAIIPQINNGKGITNPEILPF